GLHRKDRPRTRHCLAEKPDRLPCGGMWTNCWPSSRRERTRTRRSRLHAPIRGGAPVWWSQDGRMSSMDLRERRRRDPVSAPAAAFPAFQTSRERCEACPSVPPDGSSGQALGGYYAARSKWTSTPLDVRSAGVPLGHARFRQPLHQWHECGSDDRADHRHEPELDEQVRVERQALHRARHALRNARVRRDETAEVLRQTDGEEIDPHEKATQ